MKKLKTYYLFAFTLVLSLSCFSQQRAVTNIQKNLNEAAKELEYKLSFTLDTLTLKNKNKILRVSFLDHQQKDTEIIDVDAYEVKIPLYHFPKGRYSLAVYTEEKIIILNTERKEDISIPENAIADLEESILRSSLSEEEQLNRNIKPLKKKPRITKEKETRLASAKPKVTREKKVRKKRVAAVRPKKEPRAKRAAKKRPNAGKKSGFALALDRKEKAAKEVVAKYEKDKMVVASNDKVKTPRKSKGTLITVTKVTYNLTDKNSKSVDKQTRADYRANNLRPNGTAYEN